LQGGDPRPFEVVGIPLPEPGYHVVEIESRRLGQALLDKAAPMYVRTGVLVTNLGVHVKQGRENTAVWVTSLDRGSRWPMPRWRCPTAGQAPVGRPHRRQRRGAARRSGWTAAPRPARRRARSSSPHARPTTRVSPTMAFVFSGWTKGIEPWRFNVPVSDDAQPDVRAHTVFDRTLLRAGETVSMKHFVRRETGRAWRLGGRGTADAAEDHARRQRRAVHAAAAMEGHGRSASQQLEHPGLAKLGSTAWSWTTRTRHRSGAAVWPVGDFRVEEFRIPLIDARLLPPRTTPVAPKELAAGVQLNYLSGGGVAPGAAARQRAAAAGATPACPGTTSSASSRRAT
jgi:hypothetical protein